jgi:RNase adaptor protein for sRNA GlmZ degradation
MKVRDRSLLLRRRSLRRKHCLKTTTMNTKAIAEEQQLRLKVATKIKHDAEPKRKGLVSP